MELQGRIVGYPQVEKGGDTRGAKVEAVLMGGLDEALGELGSLFNQQLGKLQPLHLLDAGDARGEGDGGHPVGAGVGHGGDGVLEEVLTAQGRDVVAVGQGLAEADEVGLKAEVVIRAGKVKTEARSYVVHDEDGVGIGAELAHLIPEALGGELIVHEVAVHVGLGDDGRDFAFVAMEKFG